MSDIHIMSKDEFVSQFKADQKARKEHKKHINNDIAEYQCEARRRMKARYRGTNLRTIHGVQIARCN